MLRVIFGGTFDPIHNGHVLTSLFAFHLLKGDQLHVMPSAQPPHREFPGASAAQRLEMVRLAYADQPDVCRALGVAARTYFVQFVDITGDAQPVARG